MDGCIQFRGYYVGHLTDETMTPILFLSDSIELSTGLARVTRDIASRVSKLPNVRVGTLGRGGVGGCIPYNCGPMVPSYVIPHTTIGHAWDEWGTSVIERVWRDFAGGQRGVLMTVWDATRLLLYAQPKYLRDEATREFLTKRPFKLWGYFPIDGECEDGRLDEVARETLEGYDRVVAYGSYGSKVMNATTTIASPAASWIPHAIDTDIFRPRDRAIFRDLYHIPDNAYVVGIVMTNQARKDWGLAARVCAELRKWIPRLRLWWHVDTLERAWSIPALLHDYKLGDIAIVSHDATDEWMANAYSACDITLLPSLGEGWGFPIVESMACGTPCVHGDYAGGAELTPLLVPPVAWRIESLHNVKRPVFESETWVKVVMEVHDSVPAPDEYRTLGMLYSWERVWPQWEQWFKSGLGAL